MGPPPYLPYHPYQTPGLGPLCCLPSAASVHCLGCGPWPAWPQGRQPLLAHPPCPCPCHAAGLAPMALRPCHPAHAPPAACPLPPSLGRTPAPSPLAHPCLSHCLPARLYPCLCVPLSLMCLLLLAVYLDLCRCPCLPCPCLGPAPAPYLSGPCRWLLPCRCCCHCLLCPCQRLECQALAAPLPSALLLP